MTMTPEERQLCRGLIIHSNGRRQISDQEFLLRFPLAVDNGKLALRFLEAAHRTREDDDLLCTLLVGFTFGFGLEHVGILCQLSLEDWHTSHEDVVSALDDLRTPDAIDAFYQATQWIPEYLDYDEARALAVKAIWGLGNLLPNPEAERRLKMLADSEDVILQGAAREQLERRNERR